jgi:hypothetical protein
MSRQKNVFQKSPARRRFQPAQARTAKARARAHYELGVFHDRNSREKEAIPNYLAALKLGLDVKTKAMALAWLASSYYKTSQSKAALRRVKQAERLTNNPALRKFLAGLKQRIEKE